MGGSFAGGTGERFWPKGRGLLSRPRHAEPQARLGAHGAQDIRVLGRDQPATTHRRSALVPCLLLGGVSFAVRAPVIFRSVGACGLSIDSGR